MQVYKSDRSRRRDECTHMMMYVYNIINNNMRYIYEHPMETSLCQFGVGSPKRIYICT